VAQVVERLPSKYEVLSLNSHTKRKGSQWTRETMSFMGQQRPQTMAFDFTVKGRLFRVAQLCWLSFLICLFPP
jgi:hypothetical protein